MKDVLNAIAQGAWAAIKPIGTVLIGVTTFLLVLRMAGCGQPEPQPGPNLLAPIQGSQVLYDMHR